MAALSLVLLPLLLLASQTSSYYYMGSSLHFSPRGQDPNYAYLLELRSRHTYQICYQNNFTCALGDCGTVLQSTSYNVSSGVEHPIRWCQNEVVSQMKFTTNRPFEIRYPTYLNTITGQGYWAQSVQKGDVDWRMKAHIDLGTRSDTGKANNSPIAAVTPFLRVPQNCNRDYKLLYFDPDGDYVRCRVPTTRESYDCSMCILPQGFSLSKDTCTLHFDKAATTGIYPIELVLEDFVVKNIFMMYSDGYYTKKCPITLAKRKRRAAVNDTATTNFPPTTAKLNTTAIPTTTAKPNTGINLTATVNPTTTAKPATTANPTTTTMQTTPKPSSPSGLFVSTISPISIVPQQFTIQVDSFMALSCEEGDYFPMFLTPTPRSGIKISAYPGRMLEVPVRTAAKYTENYAFIVTGPEGIHYNQTVKNEYMIRWKPTKLDQDKYFPVCFVAEGIDKNNTIYQSELRCFIAVVQSGSTFVTCNETHMQVEVEKSEYINRYVNQLHLNDYTNPACSLNLRSNRTHLVAVMALHTCGTTLEEDDHNIIFNNKISNGDPSGLISRSLDVDIAFACAYPKRNNLTLGFRHRNLYSFTEKGFGVFAFHFDFFETSRYDNRIDLANYPLEVSFRQMMYMQIQVTTTIPSAELFVESCSATPFEKMNRNETYTIINNGCILDQTVEIYPSPNPMTFRFGLEAFEFVDGCQEVYITCVVLLCEQGFPGTRCSQGCITSTTVRGKRDTMAESSRHSISQGPVRILKPSSSTSHLPISNLNMGLNMVFIIGCLLVVTLAVHQLRRARTKYLAMQVTRA